VFCMYGVRTKMHIFTALNLLTKSIVQAQYTKAGHSAIKKCLVYALHVVSK
jgi:hypothetical protein